MSSNVEQLIVDEDIEPFAAIDPPFQFNAAGVKAFAPEVSGYYILRAVLQRVGWSSFAGKRLLDFGCGVRMVRTIHNLDLPFGLYAGVDVNAEAIDWLKRNLPDQRFFFAHLDARNQFYNPQGRLLGDDALAQLGVPECDLVMMFSVITHQSPREAEVTLRQVRHVVRHGARLYFTAFLDDAVSHYTEADPARPGHKSVYSPAALLALVERQGWCVRSIHTQKKTLQQPAFVCEAV